MQIDGPVPLYYKLELLLREQIEAGQLTPGAELPSESELTERYNVSRITVRRAMERLEEDGLIIRRRGARTILAPHVLPTTRRQEAAADFRGFEDELRRLGLSPQATLLESTVGTPPHSIAALLALPAGEEAMRFRRLGKTGGQPLWVESRYFPVSIGRALLDADPVKDSMLRLIEGLGLQVSEVRATVQAVIATPRQSQLLEIPSGSPILLHESVTFVQGNRPVQVLHAYLRSDRYRISLRAAPHPDRAGLVLTDGGYLVDDGRM